MSKSEKDLRALRDQRESEVLRRVLFWLGAAVVLEALVLLGNRFFFHYRAGEIGMVEGLYMLLNVLKFGGFIIAAAFMVWAFVARAREPRVGICRIISGAFFAGISVCSLLFLYVGASCVSILLVTIPAAAGLIMIYYLYQREFFALSTVTAFGILGLWIFRTASARYLSFYYIFTAVLAVLAIALVAFTVRLQKDKGMLSIKGNSYSIFKASANYKSIWISCGLTVLSLLLAPLFGSFFAYYAFLALIIWIFVMAVYFTSRLM